MKGARKNELCVHIDIHPQRSWAELIVSVKSPRRFAPSRIPHPAHFNNRWFRIRPVDPPPCPRRTLGVSIDSPTPALPDNIRRRRRPLRWPGYIAIDPSYHILLSIEKETATVISSFSSARVKSTKTPLYLLLSAR